MNDNPMTSSPIQFSDTNSLSSILADCWSSLDRAVTSRDCGWRLPVLATQAAGYDVRQRIVVLREVDIARRLVFAHTDLRSPKIAALQNNAWGGWLFYDHAAMSQLQITGTISIHQTDKVADRIWQSEPESSLRGYLAPFPPGTVIDGPNFNLPDSVVGRVPDRKELKAGRPNFAVIQCEVKTIEWLQLSRDGNLRAQFRYSEDHVNHEWLAP